MLLISANPTKRPKSAKSKGGNMKKRRSAAQRAATAKMLASNRRRKRTTRNPTVIHHRRAGTRKVSRRRAYRNPSSRGLFSGSNPFKELLSMEGAMMIGAAIVAPMTADYIQEKFMPSATGWTKLAVKGAVIGAGVYALAKFLKKPKVALAFGVTGAAVLASDAIRQYRATPALSGYNAQTAAKLAYSSGMAGFGYDSGMAGNDAMAFNQPFRNQYC